MRFQKDPDTCGRGLNFTFGYMVFHSRGNWERWKDVPPRLCNKQRSGLFICLKYCYGPVAFAE